jgi:tetratricopeptide (TPR) repeat protein
VAVARGRDYLQQGRPDLAFQSVFDVRDEAAGAGEAMTIAGLAMLQFGEYRGARLALERAIKLQPSQFDAAMALAELNFALGNGRRGIEVLQIAARLRPREFQVWMTMGRVYNDLGDKGVSIQAYQKAVELRDKDRGALIGLIGALLSSDSPQEAEPWITRAIKHYPDDPVLLGWAARAAFDSDRLDEAISLADRALASDSQNANALLAQARSHVVRSRWDLALPVARRAVAASPNDLGALQLLLKIETRLGLTARAAETLTKRNGAQERVELMDRLSEEIRLHPDDPELPWKMGRTAWQAGSILLASRCFEAALALNPNYQPARESLAALRASHPDLAQSSSRGPLLSHVVGWTSPPPGAAR